MIYGFAFKNKSSRILYQLPCLDFRWIMFRNNLKYFLRKIEQEKPQYIVGMGLWSGRGTKLRIETMCRNKFRLRAINPQLSIDHKYIIKPIFIIDEHSVYGKGMGTSWCNYFSYHIMEFLSSHQLSSRYQFLHIPKKMNGRFAVECISKLLYQITT
ncbi:hypothetical protein KC726_05330 [Candidatus Woesebacteria bacterium]|nr:hypothetical protein [Candidatus Woesebacteria bacterium]